MQVVPMSKLPMEGNCEVRWVRGVPICSPSSEGISTRRQVLRSCLIGMCECDNFRLPELKKRLPKLWNVVVEWVDAGDDCILFQFPSACEAQRVL